MKKVLFSILLVTFIVAGITNQASAMGRKGRSSGNSNQHQGGSSSGSQSQNSGGNGSSFQNQGSSTETFGGNQNHDHDGDSQDNNNDENSGENNPPNNPVESFYQDNPGDDKFPAATPVPEPATLTLLGMGLAAVLLKQRKH